VYFLQLGRVDLASHLLFEKNDREKLFFDKDGRFLRKIALIILVCIVLFLIFSLLTRERDEPDLQSTSLRLTDARDGITDFAFAQDSRTLIFPDDLGSHDDYQTEWWYYTGNLESEDGRPFGFQLTFFRRALSAFDADSSRAADQDPSHWRTNQIYMAHFAISDIHSDEFYSQERFSRGAVGLAGASGEPFQVWLENWSATEIRPGQVRLEAKADDFAIELTLVETMQPILHGDEGLSQKGPEPGNASYYYSIVQQEAAGEIVIGNDSFDVAGLVWMDHEFGTSALSSDAVGWDWYSLQLSDGSSLTFFEIRQNNGELSPYSSGTYIDSNGLATPLEMSDWQVEVTKQWTSPYSGAGYPAEWRITVPSLDLYLEGTPLMADQELNESTVYWEGAVSFEGSAGQYPIRAVGYIELTGYAHPMTGRF
jgi:predicted secreted hydrolase